MRAGAAGAGLDEDRNERQNAGVAGTPLSAGRDLGRQGRELQPVHRACRQGRAVPVRSPRQPRARARGHARVHRPVLARLPARRASGPAVRLPGLRPLRSGTRPPLQPQQAAVGSVCPLAARRDALARRALRLPGRRRRRRPELRPARQRALDAQVPGRGHRFYLERRSRAAPRLARDRDLRAAPARFHHAPPAAVRGRAWHFRRPFVPGRDRLPLGSGYHRGGDDADPRLRRRAPLVRARIAQLLGLQSRLLFRARAALLRQLLARRAQDPGAPAARCRHRGHPRCRVQPHRRGQPARADAVVSRHRQRLLLPPRGRRTALLRGLHRLRQRAEPASPAGAADGHGFVALLGAGDARGRFPFRSRGHGGTRTGRIRQPFGFSRRGAPGSGAVHGQAHRRAVGCRRGRLPAGRLPFRLGGMERPLSRRRAPLLEGRRRPDRRARLAYHRLVGHIRPARPPALGEHQLRDRARRFHARGSGQLQRQAQRGQPGGQPRRAQRQQQLEPRCGGTHRRGADPGPARAAEAQPARHPAAVPGHADAARR